MKARYAISSIGTAVVAAALLAACGGGTSTGQGTSGVTPSLPNGVRPATLPGSVTVDARHHRKQGTAQILIRIPHKTWRVMLPMSRRAGNKHPKYISANTQSMTVVVAGGAVPMQTFNLTPTSTGCSASGGYTTCSETAFFPTGEQTVTITLYDQPNGLGNALSEASTSVTIAAGAPTNISITLDGVPVKATVLLNGLATDNIPEGTATSVPASVTAYDADSNIIMSPGNYSTPVTLTDNDTSGVTTLSTTSVSAPGAAITLSYNGGNISSATITPSINGTAQSSGAATLTIGTPPTPNPTITEYSIPTSGSSPKGIAYGPDGAIWFTESSYIDQIGQLTSDGTFAEYSIPTSDSYPWDITAGPDDALWFTEYDGGKIGRITTGGEFTEYPITTFNSYPRGITVGPDNALWFTEYCGNKIGRITTGGTITEYSLPQWEGTGSEPEYITAGPDGALWFSIGRGNTVGQITTDGTITEYSSSTSGFTSPMGITTGPDGALWFAQKGSTQIGRITTSGALTEYSAPSGSGPFGITTGPDDALWFTECSGRDIARMTTGGTITQYSTPTNQSFPGNIITAPDGTLWFIETSVNKIGHLTGITPSLRRVHDKPVKPVAPTTLTKEPHVR